jgi:hypothetical protein
MTVVEVARGVGRQAMAESRERLAAIAITLLVAVCPARADDWRPPVTRAMLEEQFVRFEPDYRQLKAKRMERLRQLEGKLFALQAQGEPMFCSAHMLNETRWLLQSTTQWSRIDKQLWLLGASLHDRDQYFAMNQESHDGSWGVCYDEWFKKLDPMIQAINGMAGKGIAPEQTELEFLHPIDTPQELVEYLDRVRVSNIAATGLNRRDELGAVASVVAEIVFKQHVQDYLDRHVKSLDLGQDYADAFRRYVDDWQDPETGYWGPWYEIDGQVRKAADLSFTYHIVAYRKGDVRYWDKIVATTLAIQDEDYPFGWRYQGQLTDHNAYDVVRIFQLGWPHMDETQRAQAARAVTELLHWTLTDSLQPDGSFAAPAGFSSSVSDAQYYGVSLLTKTGYCSTARPFWTELTWPEAKTTCCRIAERLRGFSAQIPAAEAARRRLAEACPGCPEAPAGHGG